jgi:murein DD-endopeptidase MepM/ murein hydrolase activator NlpD
MIFKHGIGALAGLLFSLAAHPALANETATAAQIAGAVKAEAGQGRGDMEFTELFASWKGSEKSPVSTSGQMTPRAKVSIPSMIPVEGVTLTSGYGMRIHPVLGGRRAHKGIDLAGPIGTPVYATADGFVAKAEPYSSYGNYIQIEHGGDLETRYAHLSRYAITAGEHVVKGQLIGYVGTTGRSTGPHLHYEVRVAGEAVDPTPYMMAATQIALNPNGAKGGPE